MNLTGKGELSSGTGQTIEVWYLLRPFGDDDPQSYKGTIGGSEAHLREANASTAQLILTLESGRSLALTIDAMRIGVAEVVASEL